MAPPTFDQNAARRARQRTWIAVAILFGATALRLSFATRKGLVLDEFHSYFHATRATLGEFYAKLREDNHPPLSFLILRAARALFGEGELALRLPAIAFGVLEILLVGRIARRYLPHAAGTALVAMALLAASSLHLDFSTQARMYALHALCVTGVVEALLCLLSAPAGEPTRSATARLVLWTTLGLHNHYFFIQYVGLIGLSVAGFLLLAPSARPLARRLVVPAVLIALLCGPWYALGFPHQLAHALPPGGDDVGLRALAEAFVHLFFLNVRLGGPELRLAFIACGGTAILLGLTGLLRLLARAPNTEQRFAAVLLGAVAFGVPVVAVALAQFATRAGFTWHYVLPSAAAMALLIAAQTDGGVVAARTRRAATAVVITFALALSLLNATSRGSEDYPGAVEHILEQHRAGDGVIAVEWQPALFPQGQPWDYYAPRRWSSEETLPERMPMTGFTVADPDRLHTLDSGRRVQLLRTSLPGDQHLMQLLREDFRVLKREPFGFGIEVVVFERR